MIVAKNEALAIRRCIESILRLDLVNCELIMVDSASSDGTKAIMCEYVSQHPATRVLSAPACRNSAQARNIGKAHASKRFVFFLDGDIELYPDFVPTALAELRGCSADAVTGGLDEMLYEDSSGVQLGESYVRRRFSQRTKLMSCGGSYIAERNLLEHVGDYDERFDRSQDVDYSLRLTAVGILAGLPVQMGIHHTREHRSRPWGHAKSGYVLCQGMLVRKHYRRPGFLREWMRGRKSYVSGLMLTLIVVTTGLGVAAGLGTWAWFFGVVGAAIAFEGCYSIYRKQSLAATIVLHVISPPMIVAGLILEPYMKAPAPSSGDYTVAR